MAPDLWFLDENMFRGRLLEKAITRVWNEGKISGEMHLSIGEEGVVAGTIPYSRELEDQTLPNTKRIVEAALGLLNN